MKKRRTYPTLRARSQPYKAKAWRGFPSTGPEGFEDHVLSYELIRDNAARWKATNDAFSSYPDGGEFVDIPWMPFWRSVRDLYEDDFDHQLNDRWLDDADMEKTRRYQLESLRKHGRHHDQITDWHRPLLQALRDRMDSNIIAIGRVCGGPIDNFEAMRKMPGRTVPIDYMYVRFVLPDDHEAVMFKLRWGA
jgi:hypothetical protein